MIRKDGAVDTTFTSDSIQQSARYYEEAPETISVPVVELLARIPSEYCSQRPEASLSDSNLDLPCHEVFVGNTPRLRLGLCTSCCLIW